MDKERLDVLVHARGLAESRESAKAAIMSGNVYVGGNRADKPGHEFPIDADIEVKTAPAYVSRGGLKLEKALAEFSIDPDGVVCLDCGASTGGFTDCLLKRGAKLVYAVDVGYGQLAWKIRIDPRVRVMERTNIRHATAGMFDPKPGLAVIDVSFISLKLVLPVVKQILTPKGGAVCLIKPQFEAGRDKVGKKGVVRDPETHRSVLMSFISNASSERFAVIGITHSPVKGPEGNIEFLSYLRKSEEGGAGLYPDAHTIDPAEAVKKAHEELLS